MAEIINTPHIFQVFSYIIQPHLQFSGAIKLAQANDL